MKQLQKAILNTFVYHDLFEYPLTAPEVWKFLVQFSIFNFQFSIKSKFSKSQIHKELQKLKNKKKIVYKNNFYFLPRRKEIVEIRRQREKYSQEKVKIARKIIKILRFIPWLKMVGITGALAMNNSEQDDDIDFLVITAPSRLWLTRLLMIIFLEILGKRRKPRDKNIKNKICLNLFLDESFLSLSKDKRNLFTAHEIGQMKPILNRNHTYDKFLLANNWVKSYLPNAINSKYLVASSKQNKQNDKKPLDLLEKLAYQFQIKYMRSKKTNEEVDQHFAFFHPQNRSLKVLKLYKKNLNAGS